MARSAHSTDLATPRAAAALALFALLALSACKGGSESTSPGNNNPPANNPPVIPPITLETTVPPTTPGFVDARTSQIVTDGGAPTQVFDDFTSATAGTIKTVGWQGIYCVQQANAAAPAATATSFTISFYADAAGRPSTASPLQTSTFAVAQTGQTLEKTVANLQCGTAANTTWPFYKYSVTLPTPFAVTANTKYWISIQATTPSYAVYFGWRDGTPFNNSSLQLFQGTYTTYNVDRAYSLKSS
ncbi:MAG: hypothetical protein ABI601_05605 [bacterium]